MEQHVATQSQVSREEALNLDSAAAKRLLKCIDEATDLRLEATIVPPGID